MTSREIIALSALLVLALDRPTLAAAQVPDSNDATIANEHDAPPPADAGVPARADENAPPPTGDGSPQPAGDDAPPRAPLIITDPDLPPSRYWRDATNRVFVSTQIDIGFLYFRPRGVFGYGRPFYQWFGVEANPIVSTSYVGGYGGLRGVLPWIDFRAGTRFVQQISRSYLRAQEDGEFTRDDTEDRLIQGASNYLELEAELSASLDAGPGNIIAVATGTLLLGVPRGRLVYEDTMRVVTDAPGFWRGRLGYSIAVDSRRAVSVGAVGEIIGIVGRDELVIRAGIIASVKLWPNLEVRASFIPALISPDNLGVAAGDFGNLGVRWSWASD